MKIRTLVISIIFFAGYILAAQKAEATNEKIDIVGEAYNTDNKPVVAVSYGVAHNNAYTLRDEAGFMKPEMVIKLADVILPPAPGPMEAADEVFINIFILRSLLFLIIMMEE